MRIILPLTTLEQTALTTPTFLIDTPTCLKLLIRFMEILLNYLCDLRALLGQHALFSVGILLVFGYIIGKLAGRVKLPEITGFIVAGLLLGDSVMGVIPHHMNESLGIVTEVALGLIALTIGGEFYWVKLKRVGRRVIIITITQLVATFVVVSGALLAFNVELPFALLLGSIASATAPAATVAIVQSLRAHGNFVDYLYGVVALDDAGCVILFGVIFAISGGILDPSAGHGASTVILHAFGEVFFSIIIGIIAGAVIHAFARKLENKNELIIISLGLIFLSTALSIVFHLSPLLTNMAAGAVIINLSPRNHRIFRALEPLTRPIYALFFIIAGTALRPEIIMQRKVLILGA
ncbi:MAG: cation:proton antiporter, partial [Candidatus Cloacimonetes bacterium]|nr:cation:proton antiporter [Candidatus Cloacimonadota bacterium]